MKHLMFLFALGCLVFQANGQIKSTDLIDLKFDFALEGRNMHHKGLSSKGEPIDEVWTKQEKLGL